MRVLYLPAMPLGYIGCMMIVLGEPLIKMGGFSFAIALALAIIAHEDMHDMFEWWFFVCILGIVSGLHFIAAIVGVVMLLGVIIATYVRVKDEIH